MQSRGYPVEVYRGAQGLLPSGMGIKKKRTYVDGDRNKI